MVDRHRQNVKQCRSCGAPIIWSKTENNKLIPINLEAKLGGNVELREGGTLAIVVKPDQTKRRYQSHLATCPDATKHRKRDQ